MFSSAGIGETYLSEIGVDVVVANELIERRADLYKKLYPRCNMICGDVQNQDVFSQIINASKGINFLLASPPCQGMSIAGKNRKLDSILNDKRNHLIEYVFKAIDELNPSYILIENVPALLKMEFEYNDKMVSIVDYIRSRYGDCYCVEGRIMDAADYGVPQTRLRTIIKMHRMDCLWNWPIKEKHKITVEEAIGDLPSLEAGEKSDIRWHYARNHSESHVLWMKHTPTGSSAFLNPIFFPKKEDGTKIKGYESSYRRIRWDEPAPTITIRSDAVSSQRNVHPGRLKDDGTYSDARVLTPYELMILTSLPKDWNIPDDTSEILVRQVIGESVPPLMIKKIVGEIECLKE